MSSNIQMDPPTILCDMCTEEDRKPAKKTCMKCEISMCVQHLQAHLTTPVLLQTHPLTEPMALCGNTKCSEHSKILEYYCLDDMTCVCVSCAIEDQHRLHNMKIFSTAHKELLEKLKAEQQILQEKTDNEDVSLEKWEKSEREKLGRCSVRLIEAVTNLRDISLSSLSKESDWMIGLCDKKSVKNLKDGPVYGLCCKDNQLSSLITDSDDGSQSSTSDSLKVQNTDMTKAGTQVKTNAALIKYQEKKRDDPVPRPEKVEVLWNFTASTLSFFRRTGPHQREEIITIKIKANLNNWDLTPFVRLGKEHVNNTSQQQWKCSCGKVYYWDGNGYRDHSSGHCHQAKCSCGKVLGVTEMVCALC